MGHGRCKEKGFTLIELLVVLGIIALLAGLAVPNYFNSLEKARESALKQDLHIMRKAIDDYFANNDKYADDLQELVTAKYIKAVPKDPITDSDSTWVAIMSDDNENQGIIDVKSGAPGKSIDGQNYQDW
jgi:general secretion pathway protein G